MLQEPRRYFFIAGEASGDSHGAPIITEIRQLSPLSTFCGVAGPRMQEAGLFAYYDIRELAVMGFSDVFKALPRLVKLFYSIKRTILRGAFDTVLLIDAPAFNLRMAKALRCSGYKGRIIQYVSPSVWAHGQERIKTMEQYCDHLLTIFPFEKAHYSASSLPVSYVGNPTLEKILRYQYAENWRSLLHLPSDKKIIAVYPGSRLGEIQRHIPLMMETVARLHRQRPGEYHFAISCSDSRYSPLIKKEAEKQGIEWEKIATLVSANSCHFELMRGAWGALAKSGTVTLELALHRCPTVVSYVLSPLNRFIAQRFLKLSLPYYCIANIIMDREVFPEYIAQTGNAQTLAMDLERLMENEETRQRSLDACSELIGLLGSDRPSQLVTRALMDNS